MSKENIHGRMFVFKNKLEIDIEVFPKRLKMS